MAIFKKSHSIKAGAVAQATPTFIPISLLNTWLTGGLNANDAKYLELYLTVPELQAVINYKARIFAGMVVKGLDSNGDKVDLPSDSLLSKPNPLQNFKEFTQQYYILRQIFGNEFIHPLFGADPKKSVAMYNLPPLNAKVIPNEGVAPFTWTDVNEIIKRYEFQFEGKTLKYDPKEIIHFNDNQVRFENDEWLLGDSKIRPLVQPCANIISAYEARGILIQNSALGILTNETTDGVGSVAMKSGEKELLHEDYRKYGLTKSKWQLIITNASLKWQSMATDVGKLKLFEEVDSDFRTIAAQFNFPPELLQPKEGSSLNTASKDEALKQLYQEAIIPEANDWLQSIGNFLGLQLVADFSHIAVLQADLSERAKAMNFASTSLSKALEGGFIKLPDAEEQYKKFLL